jgi:hypothetical protein
LQNTINAIIPSQSPTFQEYVRGQPPWIQDLLKDHTLHEPTPSIRRILVNSPCPGEHPKIHLVTHGKVNHHNIMVYSWLDGTPSGHLLTSGRGVGRGTVTARRCEAWAQLSGALFLQHLHTYLIPNSSLSITSIVTQNGLAKNLKERFKYTTFFCNDTLSPDWKLTELSYKINSNTASDLQYHCCASDPATDPQGNQIAITHKTYRPFLQRLLSSQSNDVPSSQELSPFLPLFTCQLLLNGRTIDSHYIPPSLVTLEPNTIGATKPSRIFNGNRSPPRLVHSNTTATTR